MREAGGGVLVGLVAAQQVTAVGRDVEVHQGAERQLPVVIGPGLEGDERVDVDGAEAESLLGRVVGIDERIGADGILRVAAVARSVGGQTEADADSGLQGPVTGGPSDQIREVAKDSLKQEEKTDVENIYETDRC